MNYKRTLGHYQKTKVETSGKLDLVILCYEQTIQSLVQAKTYFEDGEYEKKAKAVQKALSIITELQGSLDMEKGGQIANNLGALYTYVHRRLLQGDIQKEIDVFDESIRILSELKEAWEGIASGPEDNAREMGAPLADNRKQPAQFAV